MRFEGVKIVAVDTMRTLRKLPVHSLPAEYRPDLVVLRVDGLVEAPLELTLADLERMPQRDIMDDFTCLEGWHVPGVKWGGVPLEPVLLLAKPLRGACYVHASAGEFGGSLSMDRAGEVLLAIRLDGERLPVEHGGPIRLVVSEGQCFMQIKWLDHLELRKEPGANTAERIALERKGSF